MSSAHTFAQFLHVIRAVSLRICPSLVDFVRTYPSATAFRVPSFLYIGGRNSSVIGY
jgi:hypothetical protein